MTMRLLIVALTTSLLARATLADPVKPTRTLLPLGRISQNVVCATAPEFHCNVYVPRGYKATTPAPVIYIFSPGGPAPVDRYQAGAEKLGWILCASVESKNGLGPEYYEAVYQAMRGEMGARFALHPRREYYSGFSGGARVSLELACAHAERAAGAIAMGAAQGGRATQAKIPGFACVGMAGFADFNYYEMVRQYRTAEAQGWGYLFLDFDGGHQWASKAIISQAFDWLEAEYLIRSPNLTDAEKAKRPAVVAECVRKVLAGAATLETYRAAELLRSELTAEADAEHAKRLDELLATLKGKLTSELDAREAMFKAYAAVAGQEGTWPETVRLLDLAKDVAAKFPNTVFGRRAGLVEKSLEIRRQQFPPELRQDQPIIRPRPQPTPSASPSVNG